MQIRFGFEMRYECAQATPMILTLQTHYTRASDIVVPDHLITQPVVPLSAYRDGFGNWCTRLTAPAGEISLSATGIVRDTGLADCVAIGAEQHAVEHLPEETLIFLLGSRYCETDLLSEFAWREFGQTAPGWPRVQAICDFVHHRIAFDYAQARATRTAAEVLAEGVGVCRDYTHLAIALCRCMNIPARYCTGYLSDIGVPPPWGPPDFAAWFEAYLGTQWHTFDPRNNTPRIGRVLIARGRDAADAALSTTFGPVVLKRFEVWTDEVAAQPA